jgi:hypothetical protein
MTHHVHFHTAETFYPPHPDLPELPPAARPFALKGRIDLATAERKVDPKAKALVRLNHGRWIVDCPFCPSAQIASASDPLFLCSDCLNFAIGSRWVRVVWPKPANRKAIEEAVHLRPSKEVMNWDPAESVADLRRENLEHGVERPA